MTKLHMLSFVRLPMISSNARSKDQENEAERRKIRVPISDDFIITVSFPSVHDGSIPLLRFSDNEWLYTAVSGMSFTSQKPDNFMKLSNLNPLKENLGISLPSKAKMTLAKAILLRSLQVTKDSL